MATLSACFLHSCTCASWSVASYHPRCGWGPFTHDLHLVASAAPKLHRTLTRRSDCSRFNFKVCDPRHRTVRRHLSIRGARMASQPLSIGFRAPEFELPEPSTGKTWKLEDFEENPGLLVMFICNHCPFVVHLKEALAKFADEYSKKGLAVVAISSNSVQSHPQDGPTFMAADAKKYGYPFPYLFDETQEVAKAFGAVCTPEFFLFKKDGRRPFELVYHGRFDETRPQSAAPFTGRDLRAAADALLSGQPVSSAQKPSIGCSIKWHVQS